MIELARIRQTSLETQPYRWAAIDRLFTPDDCARLARSYPVDHYKLVTGYGGEKDYEYEARELMRMGGTNVAHAADLSEAWRELANDLLSAEYRAAMSALSGIDLGDALLEVNVFHYGPGSALGAHTDLPDKLVTHVLYFNEEWNPDDGGCLAILRANDPKAVAARIPPVIGNSAVLVRSENSWHQVTPVDNRVRESRRSVTATFYRPGSVTTMWTDANERLHSYGSWRRTRRFAARVAATLRKWRYATGAMLRRGTGAVDRT